jgi:hypothetical protein
MTLTVPFQLSHIKLTMSTPDFHKYANATMRAGCHAPIAKTLSMYDYNPTLAASIAMSLLFGLSFSGHVIRGIQIRRWTSFICSMGAFSETSKYSR